MGWCNSYMLRTSQKKRRLGQTEDGRSRTEYGSSTVSTPSARRKQPRGDSEAEKVDPPEVSPSGKAPSRVLGASAAFIKRILCPAWFAKAGKSASCSAARTRADAGGAAAGGAVAGGSRAGEAARRRRRLPAVAVDCEMVGVGAGAVKSELGRVSIVDEDLNVVMDCYVRPESEVTDFRTPVSGLRPELLASAAPFIVVQEQVKQIFANRIIIGHSVHHDLEVLKIVVEPSRIRDTAAYVPLRPPREKKRQPKLKTLAALWLKKQIQQSAHDSVVDAVTTMELYLMHRDAWELTFDSSGEAEREDVGVPA